jgi:hypothetical protein
MAMTTDFAGDLISTSSASFASYLTYPDVAAYAGGRLELSKVACTSA